jgi:hypothetical protein
MRKKRLSKPLKTTPSRTHKGLAPWLRDAHAMEQRAEQMLKAQASHLKTIRYCATESGCD